MSFLLPSLMIHNAYLVPSHYPIIAIIVVAITIIFILVIYPHPHLHQVRHMSDVCGLEPVNKPVPTCQTHFTVMNTTSLGSFMVSVREKCVCV